MSYFLDEINELSQFHYLNCDEYKKIIYHLFGNSPFGKTLEDMPFIPVSLFKEMELKSVSADSIFKVIKSSGTQGKQSQIFLSRENSKRQIVALKEIFQSKFGNARRPMIFFDSKEQILRSATSSARKAAVIGFSAFASERYFVLRNDLTLDWEELQRCMSLYQEEQVLIFGFTFLLWTTLVKDNKTNLSFDLPNGVILHGGGWKNIEGLGISKEQFKEGIKRVIRVNTVADYYGMAEQAGSVFFECTKGFFHSSKYSNVVIRDPYTLLPLPFGKSGLVQVISSLPLSYPGHSILTQDIGTLYGENNCPCKGEGRYFTIDKRLPKSQIRGCSDVGF